MARSRRMLSHVVNMENGREPLPLGSPAAGSPCKASSLEPSAIASARPALMPRRRVPSEPVCSMGAPASVLHPARKISVKSTGTNGNTALRGARQHKPFRPG